MNYSAIEKKTVKLNYIDGDNYYFLDENWDEVVLSKADLGNNARYLKPYEVEGDDDDYPLEIVFNDGKAVDVLLPAKVIRRITYCEPGMKVDSYPRWATNPATLDTGIEVMVPLFCNSEDRIVIDTRDGSFIERAKDCY